MPKPLDKKIKKESSKKVNELEQCQKAINYILEEIETMRVDIDKVMSRMGL